MSDSTPKQDPLPPLTPRTYGDEVPALYRWRPYKGVGGQKARVELCDTRMKTAFWVQTRFPPMQLICDIALWCQQQEGSEE